MWRSLAVIVAIAQLFAVSLCSDACYTSNGTQVPTTNSKKCTFNGITIMCCGPHDTCLENGLCKINTSPPTYWRDTCAYSNWTEGGCLNMCTGYNVNSLMTPCDDPPDNSTTWCCDESKSCCGSDSAVKLDRNIYTVKPSSTSTPTATATATASPTVSDTPGKSKTSGLSTGGKAGLGVGIAAGALAVFALMAWFLLRRRKNPGGDEDETSPIYMGPIPRELPPNNQVYEKPGDEGAMRHEKSTADGIYEKPGDGQTVRHELPGHPPAELKG